MPGRSCPAVDMECHNCGKIGHFTAVCRSKKPTNKPQEKKAQDGKEEDSQEESGEEHRGGDKNDSRDSHWLSSSFINEGNTEFYDTQMPT